VAPNTDLMDALYIGVDMQRNRSFTDWHAYDKVVLQDYRNLGGVGEPAWRKQNDNAPTAG